MSDSIQPRIAVLGAVRSGLAAARLAQRKGSAVTLFDEADTSKLSRSIDAAAQAGIKLVHGATASDAVIQPGDFDLCILSPGFDLAWPLPAKFAAAGIPLTGELEFAAQCCSFPMVAITGTNGKSTTTEILAEIFNHCGKRSLPCGNHGTALSEVLLSDQAYDVLSLEVSSFQLETIDTFHPHISMWLNFAADHLDRYPDEKTYFEAKRRIFGNQTSADYAIVNIQELRRLGDLAPQVISFTSQPEHCAQATYCFRDGKFYHQGEVIGSSEHLRLRGRHNMENVLAAIAAGSLIGLDYPAMFEALATYVPPKHRCELVRIWEGREFINDSKATNLHALESCIRSLDAPIVLIVGGKEKGLDYSPLAASLPGRVKAMVTLGEIGPALQAQFASQLPCQIASDMDHAVALAADLSTPGDSIVLSPGTSSFDRYSGYAERGEHFRSAALSL